MLSSQGKKLAQALGMLALPESNFICGKVGDFPISIYIHVFHISGNLVGQDRNTRTGFVILTIRTKFKVVVC